MGTITLPFHPQRTSVLFGEQKYLMSSDQLFNILLFLLFSGIALGLIYYQPLLDAAPKTRINFVSSSLSYWSISQTAVYSLRCEGVCYPLYCT